MNFAVIITGAVLFLGVGIGVVLATHDIRVRRTFLTGLAAELGARVTSAGGAGEYRGYRYEFRHTWQRNQGGTMFRVLLKANVPEDVIITPASQFQRMAHAAELVNRALTGDAEFDAAFFVNTRGTAVERYQLRDAALLRHVRNVFLHGATRVDYSVEEQAIVAEWEAFRGTGTWTAENITRVLDDLLPLAAPLPQTAVNVEVTTPRYEVNRFLPFYMFAATCFGIGGFLAMLFDNRYTPVDRSALFAHSLEYSLPLLVLFAFAAYLSLRRNLEAYRYWLGVVIFGALGFPVAGYASVLYANGGLDTDESAEWRYHVISTEKRPSNGSFEHWAFVRLSDDSEPSRRMLITRELFHALAAAPSDLLVVDHPGWLGFPWRNPHNDIRLVSRADDRDSVHN